MMLIAEVLHNDPSIVALMKANQEEKLPDFVKGLVQGIYHIIPTS
jgi:hypothetical protein